MSAKNEICYVMRTKKHPTTPHIDIHVHVHTVPLCDFQEASTQKVANFSSIYFQVNSYDLLFAISVQ